MVFVNRIAPSRVASAGEESPHGTIPKQFSGISYEGHPAGDGTCADIKLSMVLCTQLFHKHAELCPQTDV